MFNIHWYGTAHKFWEYKDLAGIRAALVTQYPTGEYVVYSNIVADTVEQAEAELIAAAADFHVRSPGRELLVAHPEIDPGEGIRLRDIIHGRTFGSIYVV